MWPTDAHCAASARSRRDVSVVVPAFNEAGNVTELLSRICTAVRPLGNVEVIIVDDGSKDGTWAEIQAAAKVLPEVIGVRLQRNFGQHAAASAGFALARGDVIVTIDADLQNPPEEIPKLVARLGPDCDVASGWRTMRKDSKARTFPSSLMNWVMAKVTGVKLHDYGCMLRAYKREVIDQLQACPEASRAITALVSWLGVTIVELPVEHHPRSSGRSRYGYWKLIKMSFDILTGFSTGTLQAVSLTGIAVSLLGFATGVFLVIWRLVHGAGPIGINTFLSALFFLGGMQLAAIGIVGEYVGRVFTEVQHRPQYIVSEILGAEASEGTSAS